MADKKRKNLTGIARRRLFFLFAVIALIFTGLALRLGYHMIIKGDEYSQKATVQQTSDKIVAAARGSILDRNGGELAISATANTIWLRPYEITGNGKTDEEKEANLVYECKTLADILELEYNYVYETATSEKRLVKLAKNVSTATADIIRGEKLKGIEIIEDAKRYYPLGSFASQILGSTTDDNVGLTGIESYYNRYLAGINGRWIMSKDGSSNEIIYGTDKYYSAEDGSSVVLTIDENIQYIVEQKIQETKEKTEAARVMCMIQDPKTGEILSMAQTDEYDPNDPRKPSDPEILAAFANMTEEEQLAYWNKMWRCFCISDTYEPGSTFKLITTSIALDAGVTYLDDIFYCNGMIHVADWDLKCAVYPGNHGKQTLVQAVGNSCNPAMVTLVQRLGLTKYYDGLDAFCLTERTGVDYPGEGYNILQKRSDAGPVGLATMAYGQGIAVTPIGLVTAISSLANDGKLMQPHFVKEIRSADGETVKEIKPVVKSVSVSEQTAQDMLGIMEEVIDEGGGSNAKIPGYRIGGKTGTANKPVPGGYSETDVYASFIGIAPIDDPKFTILVIIDTPKGVISGGKTAAPAAREIMQEVLRYMNITPNYTEQEIKKLNKTRVEVPSLTGYTLEDAIGILANKELEYQLSPAGEFYENLIIVDQYPKAGSEVGKGSIVTLYHESTNYEPEVLTEDGEVSD